MSSAPVHEDVAPARPEGRGRGNGVAVRHIVGAPPRSPSTAPPPSPSRARRPRGRRHRPARPPRRDDAVVHLARPRGRRPRREPQRQVTTCRVAATTTRLASTSWSAGERVDRRRHVVERSRPPATLLADAPVLEVPRGEPVRGDVAGERRHHRAVPALAPEAAVHEHDTRPRDRPRRREGGGSRPGRDGRRSGRRVRAEPVVIRHISVRRRQRAVPARARRRPGRRRPRVVEVGRDAEVVVSVGADDRALQQLADERRRRRSSGRTRAGRAARDRPASRPSRRSRPAGRGAC